MQLTSGFIKLISKHILSMSDIISKQYWVCHISNTSHVGIVQDDKFCKAMTEVSPGQINFTAFLTFMGEKLADTDPEDVLHNAFACFDIEGTGFIQQNK